MVQLVVVKNAGPVEEVVDQAVDGNQVESYATVVPAGVAGQEEAGQGHVGELRADVGDGGDFSDEILHELINCSIGQMPLAKVLLDIRIKVPLTERP
jgi:hypothetical protein